MTLLADETLTATPWLTALRESHDRVSALVSTLEADVLVEPAYPAEWSIAQVLSHLGSGAEIFTLFLEAGLAGTEAPGIEKFHPVWDVWNARGPVEVRDAFLVADDALVTRVEGLDTAAAAAWQLDMFGMDLDLSGLLRLRLGEHAVHSWDVAVALDPSAVVAPHAVDLLFDHLGPMAARSGKGSDPAYRVRVSTTSPDHSFTVAVGEGVSLGADDGGAYDGSIELTAEAFLRLVYGRLDPDHASGVVEHGERGLDDLRLVLPGF